MDGIFDSGLYNYLCGAVAATEALVHSRTAPQGFGTRWAWLFGWVARSEGVQTIAPLGAIGPIGRLTGLFLSHLLIMVRGPAQIRHTPACVQAGSRVALPHG